ncbi:MAG: TA system VapC family ribonuclease toxin [Candidatus Promineifilaceae bacterium]
MTTYLLDVNLLLALSDPMHVHHDVAHRWFKQTGRLAWATCPLTENGFVRIASHPRYPNRPGGVEFVLDLLRQFCAVEGHHFWAEGVSIRRALGSDVIITSDQVTDVYLLALAAHRGGKLATLDRSIPAAAVPGGAAALELIEPAGARR